MINNNNQAMIAEIQYLQTDERVNLPSVEEIKKYGLSDELVAKLRNLDSRFNGDLEVFCRICDKDEVYVDLEVSCFSCDNGRVSKWHHNKDGCRSSNTEISNKAYIRCKKCYTDRPMWEWNFECSNHRGEPRSINYLSYRKAMSTALGVRNCSQVIIDLSTYIACHPEKFN